MLLYDAIDPKDGNIHDVFLNGVHVGEVKAINEHHAKHKAIFKDKNIGERISQETKNGEVKIKVKPR